MKSVFLLLLIVLVLDSCFAKKGGKEGKGGKCKAKALCKQFEEMKAIVSQLQKEMEEVKAPKPCIPNPCKNDGTCKNLGENQFECTCKPGFEGADCSTQQSSFQSNSEILQDRPDVAKHLAEFLKPVELNGREWKMCFRASDNSYSVSTFHTYCNSKGPTVTLVKVGRNVFGGYSDIAWQSNAGYTRSDKAFLFSFDNRALAPFKMDISQHPEYAIYSNAVYGPTFGGGHDLYIADQCHVNINSYSNLGHSYRLPSGYTYSSTQAKELFAGSYQFRCDDYEVFYQV